MKTGEHGIHFTHELLDVSLTSDLKDREANRKRKGVRESGRAKEREKRGVRVLFWSLPVLCVALCKCSVFFCTPASECVSVSMCVCVCASVYDRVCVCVCQ